MKVIYIAGKYRDRRGEAYVFDNICKARDAALDIWELGGVALCPHMNTAFFGGVCPDDVWLKGDLELLSRCDAVLAIENWKFSEGAKKEVEYAKENEIPVFYSLEEVIDFIKYGDR